MRVRGLRLYSTIIFGALLGSTAWSAPASPLPAAASPTAAAAKKQGHVSSDYIFPYLAYYWSLPAEKRTMFVPSYTVSIDGHPPSGWDFYLKVGDKLEPIPVDRDGRVKELPSAQDLAGHPDVVVRVPPDQAGDRKLETKVGTTPLITPALEIDASKCALAIDQVNGAVPKAARMMGLAPTIKAVGFKDASSGVAVLEDGKTVALPLSEFGAPMYDPKKIPGARLIRLDRVPTQIIMI
jgi:hypothetical protein